MLPPARPSSPARPLYLPSLSNHVPPTSNSKHFRTQPTSEGRDPFHAASLPTWPRRWEKTLDKPKARRQTDR